MVLRQELVGLIMKRLIPVILLLSALAGLASCGSKAKKSDCGDGNGVCHIGDKKRNELPSIADRLI
jgi:hypothetical protein